MRRISAIVLVSFLFVVSSLAFAGEDKGSMMGKGMMMAGQGKMMEMCPMHGMMKSMMVKSIVATEDGGVVVMTGNRLLKYDKNLNLKKEVEIKMDMEGMQKMMQMMEKCPMHEKMMGKDEMTGQTKEESKELEIPSEVSGHEARH